jgi:MoaA/NifB/PqqE/SkfB family radical SAM enzyme
MTTPTYCPLPWLHINVQPTGTIVPCCLYIGKMEFNNSFDQLKTAMLNGEQVRGCQYCYDEESCGKKSLRMLSIERFGIVTEEKLRSVEIAIDNVCNLKCRGCSSRHSHLWYDDEITLFGATVAPTKFLKNTVYDTLDYSTIERIAIHGGEPFLNLNFKKICKKLLEANVLEDLEITTNATLLPDAILEQVLLSVDTLKLKLSIDGIGKINDYFRSGSEFDKIEKNLEYFYSLFDRRQNKNTLISISTTVNTYNVNLLNELDAYFSEKYPKFQLTKHCLRSPEPLAINNMPDEYKQQVMIHLTQYPYVSKFMQLPPTSSFDSFIYFHDQLDEIRGEKLGSSNILLSKFIDEYKVKYFNLNKAMMEHQEIKSELCSPLKN